MLKHLPSDALKTIQKTLLYYKKPVYLAKVDYDRRNYNSQGLIFTGLSTADANAKKLDHARYLNNDEIISLFQNQLKNE